VSDREERIDERERYLIRQIEILRQEYINRCKPFGEELAAIRLSRGPQDVFVDGKVFHYTGPLPPYLLPEERQP
jgi:hypothetical protein